MAPKPSARANVNAFLAMDVMGRAIAREKRGEPVVYMCVGEPGTPAPSVVRAAAEAALKSGRLGYTEALGLASLRAAIARHYGDHYGLDIAPERVAVTTGSSAGFDLAFLAAFDPGDRVAIASPGYPPYRNILTALGLVLASRKILIARNDLLSLLHDMEKADGAQRTARLASFKQLQRDIDRQVLEKAGFALLILGTLIWGFGDLVGRL